MECTREKTENGNMTRQNLGYTFQRLPGKEAIGRHMTREKTETEENPRGSH